uniref:Uncharacterized protein n=1 Tax=Cacopsylla melanoneura TaxID=428564 RepID=A0A8D8ZS41_9HEMI
MNHNMITQKLRSNTKKHIPQKAAPKLTSLKSNKQNTKKVTFNEQSTSPRNINCTTEANKTPEIITQSDVTNSDQVTYAAPQEDPAPSTCTPIPTPLTGDSNLSIVIPITNTSRYTVPTHTMHDNSNEHNINNSTFSSNSVGTQTENENWDRDNLMRKIRDRDSEIENLKQTIIALEQYIQNQEARQEIQQAKQPPAAHNGNKVTCHIIGDSHVRGLRDKLSSLLPKGSTVESFFQPGAGFHPVATTIKRSPNLINTSPGDTVILICGTNDIGTTKWEQIQEAIDELLLKFRDCKSICFVGTPLRYKNKHVNFHINRFNAKVKKYLSSKSCAIMFLDPNSFLKRTDYAKDGLHLNGKGKGKLCNKIKNKILAHSQPVPQTRQSHSIIPQFNPEDSILNIDSILNCDNLIDFDFDRIQVNGNSIADVNNREEINFDPSNPNYYDNFPELRSSKAKGSPHQVMNRTISNIEDGNNTTYLESPGIPGHVYNLLNNEPNTSTNYYRLAPICNSSVQDTSIVFTNRSRSNNMHNSSIFPSPITRIEPGFNRSNRTNFNDPGQAPVI